MKMSRDAGELLYQTIDFARNSGYEYVTPEHLLYLLTFNRQFGQAFADCGGDVELLREQVGEFLSNAVYLTESGQEPQLTEGMNHLLAVAQSQAASSGREETDVIHLVYGLFLQEESFGVYYIEIQGVEEMELLSRMTELGQGESGTRTRQQEGRKKKPERWEQYAPCLNDIADTVNPLIGREEELERTIQILCRKEKNNPLHIGEPGVGKTAITFGLARRLRDGKVPEALKGGRIFSLDLGGMLAGTQYRGDFEKRFKEIMSGIEKEKKPIVYIDEIHNIVGAGAVNGGSLDASNLLKTYLAQGHVRFIGATTYTEYKKHFEKNRSLVRRFQNVVIHEPSQEDTVKILEGLREGYEQYHGVKYEEGVLAYAVAASVRYMNERFLPDKAIDLIDEAGAYRQLHPLNQPEQTVDRKLIDQVLTSICQVPIENPGEDGMEQLAMLKERMESQIFGQEEAVDQVVNAVKFARAGLMDEGKPMASLLFVGPTGVGKTEVARTLARELGVSLIRFDMSEYGEKHAVAKLIGAPAGYVGYEEGGLLTEAVRKSPYAVVLLDEIEKAHPDIYNVLLQVMDYATLTDNQGRKADFSNVILIMTSNAGASRLGKEQIGFSRGNFQQDVITEEVKHIFQPEFLNRLNRIVIFHPMDEKMAEQITVKKLTELKEKLAARGVDFRFTGQASAYVREHGISREYGAREIQRVIDSQIKPLLSDALLFGTLKSGGVCCLDAEAGTLRVEFPGNS